MTTSLPSFLTMFSITKHSRSRLPIFLSRSLRSSANKDRRLPKFVRGSVKTLDKNVADKLGPVESYDELNRALKDMFVDPDAIQSEVDLENEEEAMSLMFRAKGLGEQMTLEQLKLHERSVRREAFKKKYFKAPNETNLLTFAAKKQIRYLHQINPEEWSPERLSECFPISVVGVKRLLKNTFKMEDPEKIAKHDAEVAKRWETLQSGNQFNYSISPTTVKMWREGQLVKDYYSGNVNLPQLPEPKINEVKLKPKKVGEHLALIKKYLDIKKETEEKNLLKEKPSSTHLFISSSQQKSGRGVQEDVLPHLERINVHKSDIEDPLSTSFLATSEIDENEPEMLYDQFKQNLTEEYSNKKNKSQTDQDYLDWLEAKGREKNLEVQTSEIVPSSIENSNPIKKYNQENAIELKVERGVAYLYDDKVGYHHPLGKENVKHGIKIPSKMYKKGAVYKVGRCFYDDSGEFLYRLPFEIN